MICPAALEFVAPPSCQSAMHLFPNQLTKQKAGHDNPAFNSQSPFLLYIADKRRTAVAPRLLVQRHCWPRSMLLPDPADQYDWTWTLHGTSSLRLHAVERINNSTARTRHLTFVHQKRSVSNTLHLPPSNKKGRK